MSLQSVTRAVPHPTGQELSRLEFRQYQAKLLFGRAHSLTEPLQPFAGD
jgi:hypothetical protein